jgi:ABC-type transport system involved in multi-copper enzyme maturation permease subunit
MAKKLAVIARPLTGLWSLFRSNPIIVKELRGRMRAWRGMYNLAFYTLALGCFGMMVFVSIYSSRNYYGYYNYNAVPTNPNVVVRPISSSYSSYGADTGNQLLLALIIAQLVLIIFLSPAFTVGALAGEKERQTYDILLTTLLRPRDIVLGKLFSSQAYLCLMIVAALPVLCVVFLVGGVSLSQLAIGLAVLILTTLLMGSISIYWSAASRTTGRAFRSVFFLMLLMFLAIPGLGVLVDSLVRNNAYTNAYYFNGGTPYIPPDWLQVYTNISWSFNPAVAMVLSYNYLSNRSSDLFIYQNSFYSSSGTRLNGVSLPMPWLTFSIMAVVLSILFIWLATRRVKPLNVIPSMVKRKRGKKAKFQPTPYPTEQPVPQE